MYFLCDQKKQNQSQPILHSSPSLLRFGCLRLPDFENRQRGSAGILYPLCLRVLTQDLVRKPVKNCCLYFKFAPAILVIPKTVSAFLLQDTSLCRGNCTKRSVKQQCAQLPIFTYRFLQKYKCSMLSGQKRSISLHKTAALIKTFQREEQCRMRCQFQFSDTENSTGTDGELRSEVSKQRIQVQTNLRRCHFILSCLHLFRSPLSRRCAFSTYHGNMSLSSCKKLYLAIPAKK